MISTRKRATLAAEAAGRREFLHSLAPDQRLGWVEGELRSLLLLLERAYDEGDTPMLGRFAALLAAEHDISTPALQRFAEVDDE